MPLNPLIINSLAEAVSSEQMILTDLITESNQTQGKQYYTIKAIK